ncbi:MAG: phenylalanine--tRNA ligase subunit beta [Chloroflexi bacterium]|nr:phenylalanine--tRNA ligase subunit beta [Chloroflexota bacterium]MDA1218093.1 phenylalanine--tRNA ligase subunit beta [Chloroflexota bacterium]
MRVPLSWLKEYVDVEMSAQELAHRLTMAGVEAGDVIELGGWTGCYVGHVLSVEQHPNADRLSLCRVDIGSEQMQVVCGAPNVAAGQKICFAKVGAYLYNTHSEKHENLKPARIRGVVSEGMICSELELGLGDGHEGIVVLPDDAPIGVTLDSYLGDTVIDLEVTANRLDCFSILGVAHEVAAITGKTVREPDISYQEGNTPIAELATVSVADPDLCPRYTASVIQGIKIGDSPQWLQDRLTKAGLRPINNVVDVTNYVMLEFNQPLHAFDLDKLRDHTIIVRRARPGEVLDTLDGAGRILNPDVLVIADSHDPVGIGGVIGGANSEIGPDTTNVLLESATFDNYNNRQTAETFRLRTDATQRFEKGLRPELAPIGLRRATQLIQQVSGGEIAQGIVDIYQGRDAPHPTVPLSLKRLKQVLGMELDIEKAAQVLQSLGIQTKPTEPGSLNATIPYWRNDINIEEDLIEEVVRIIGYDEVPTTMLSTPIPNHHPSPMTELKWRVREAMAAAGLQETISYPLVSLESLEKVNQLDQENLPLHVANPMSVGQEYLRPTLRASLLQTLLYNQEHMDAPFRLFEVGRAFLPRKDELPVEQEIAAGVVSGLRSEPSWLEQDGYLDFFDAKGILSSALERLGVTTSYQPTEDPTCHPGRCARIIAGDTELGIIGEVHPEVRARLDLKPLPVVLFELQLEQILKVTRHSRDSFRPLSRFPAATRDLALIVAADLPAGKVQEILGRHRLVENVELFDVYTGDNIPAGTRSLAWHVYFQSQERTLTNEEVNRTLEGLLRALEREVGATLRGS